MGCAFILEGENHSFFSCSYTSFRNLREFIAKKIGINLSEMEFYGGKKPWHELGNEMKNIHLIFAFKDCEGDLAPIFNGKLAKGLEEFLENLEDGELFKYSNFHAFDLKPFIDGLKKSEATHMKVSIH